MLEVSLLGPVEAVVDGERRTIGSPAQRVLLGVLALRLGSVVSSDRLIDVVWDGAPPPSAAAGLHVYVSRLRKTVGSDHLVTRPPGYALVDATTDVARFEERARSVTYDTLAEALELWRGDPFGELADREPFRAEAVRLWELRDSVAERRLELALETDPLWVVAEAEALCEEQPLREGRWALLARALSRVGRTAEAIRALASAREALGEVGLEPSPLLVDLEDQLLTSPPDTRPPRTGAGIGVPAPTAPMIGREADLEALASLLDSHRLVTLVGPGGVGKTMMARIAAADHPARFCELAQHEDPAAVVPAVARAVGAPVAGEIEETLIESLRARELLLLIDNCEHLVGETARLAERVLANCPEVKILATSREALSVPAEWVLRVEPLDTQRAAVEMFRQRARAGGVPAEGLDDATVERICRLLDGLPLAVEMAAARVPGMGVAELADRLERSLGVLQAASRTAATRHRTLEQVVEWSVDLLAASERLALDRVSVFAGAFDLVSAEEVIAYGALRPDDVPGLLAALADRSLLHVEHDGPRVRYVMLDTVRRVVREWLTDEVGAGLVLRHARHYARLATDLGRHLIGPSEADHAARVIEELPDLRAAVFRSLETEPDAAVRICVALYPLAYHQLRADIAAWADRVFPVVETSGHSLVPTVGAMAALSAVHRGDLTAAVDRCRRARAVATSRDQLFHVIEVEGDVAAYTGRLDDLESFETDILAAARANGDPAAETLAVLNLGLLQAYAGDHRAAAEAVLEVRTLQDALPSETLAAWVDYMEGEVYLDRDPARSSRLLDRAVATARSAGNRFVEGVAGLSGASLEARHGEAGEARDRFAAVIRHWLEIGDWIHQWVTLRNLALLLERLDDLEGAALLLGKVARTERPTYGDEAELLEGLSVRLRSGLGDAAYEEARRRGARLADREVVELALSRLEGPARSPGILSPHS